MFDVSKFLAFQAPFASYCLRRQGLLCSHAGNFYVARPEKRCPFIKFHGKITLGYEQLHRTTANF